MVEGGQSTRGLSMREQIVPRFDAVLDRYDSYAESMEPYQQDQLLGELADAVLVFLREKEPSAEEIDAGARALFEEGGPRPSWDSISADVRERFRHIAKAALVASAQVSFKAEET